MLPGFFAPRIVYSSGPAITIDFPEALDVIVTPGQALRGENTSLGGVSETVGVRQETRVLLGFTELPTATIQELAAFWNSHGWLRKQFELTLDRLATCAGQWEYDSYNAYFTKAELLTNPFQPRRPKLSRATYQFQLLIRQGK